jgi:copper chaperone NosL
MPPCTPQFSRRPSRLLALAATACFLMLTAALGLAAQKPGSPVPKEAKCPVCGMLVAKYPNWNASVGYRDGTTAYFDGPKDLFNYYLNPQKYDPAKKRADIVSITVKDYYSLASIDARQAYFVVGSNVLGPMGKELIPFARKADADAFLADHQGRRELRFSEVTPALLKTLE